VSRSSRGSIGALRRFTFGGFVSVVALMGCEPRAPVAEVTAVPIRGFNFTHEGYRGRGGGYGSRESLESLDRVKSIGANAIAVVPYSFMGSPSEAAPLRIPPDRSGESDARIAQVIRGAHERGLQVMLKPQIWIRRSWPGDIEMESETEWSAFFEHYREWIVHYALLAERENVSFLSVGVEMGHASRRTQAWRDIIAAVRSEYSGKLAYSANWYDEYEHVEFWDALDLIGVNVYFPLATRVDATDDMLAAGAGEAIDRLERLATEFEKPVLITEAGFGSSAAPWTLPHASDKRDLEASPADQAKAYDAFMGAMEGRPWLAGVLFWKWPSHGRVARSDQPTFSPVGTPTESLLAGWWVGH